ncbi:membrane cofactor protein-like isoform X3 [Talpa occidentalis]|uniref:membrane cofactor protein-like isoform X3 n=1 Tax=Talpa occidentalis TaxID=50954 RepID=UPI0023F7F5B5|nr:membrane cofactor protein-like isoform X3 [Talpa occidentalis]
MPAPARRLAGALALALALLLPRRSGACDDLPKFQSMKVKGTPKTSYSPGEQVAYECRPGYRHKSSSGDILVTCSADGTWNMPQEACVKKSCRNPGDPLNGRIITGEGNFDFGASITYTCNEGFRLLGEKTLHCQLSGNQLDWDEIPPICEKILCKPPPAIANGRYSNSEKDTFSYQEFVTYSCNPSGGQDKFSLVGESRLICSGSGEWSSAPPECRVVKCPFPVLENGFIVSGMAKKFYYKAQVELACNSGFHLSGASEIQCSANSTWDPTMPQCIHVPAAPSTKPPTSTSPGSKPVPPTRPPVSTHPAALTGLPSIMSLGSCILSGFAGKLTSACVGYHLWLHVWMLMAAPPSTTGDFSGGTTSEGIGAGFIALIVLTILGATTAVGLGLYRYQQHLKSRKRKSDLTPEYSAYQDKSTIPTEEPQ